MQGGKWKHAHKKNISSAIEGDFPEIKQQQIKKGKSNLFSKATYL